MSVQPVLSIEWAEALPSLWSTKRLDTLASVKARLGWKGLKADEYVDEGFIFLATPNLKGDEIDFEDVNYITKARYDESPEIMLRPGDVLMVKDGATLGIVAHVRNLPAPATVNGSTAVIRTLGECDSRFLYHWLRSWGVQQLIDKMKGGMGVPHLFQSDLRRFPVALPALSEQQSIAAYLDAQTSKIDRLMDMRRRQIALLQEQRTALIQQAVTRGLTPNVPMKDSGVSWLGEIPAHWEVFTLGRLATVLQTGPFGSQLHAHEYISGGIPVLNPSHMTEAGTILHDPDCSVDDATASRLTRHQLQQGDIIFARRGEIGRCALVDADQSGWICGTGSMLMRPNQTLVTSEYLTLIFQFKHLKESLSLHSVGSTMDNLNTGILARVRLPLPTVEEQLWILNQIKNSQQQFDNIINSYLRQLTLLAEYRAALIHECVTGQREVPDMSSTLVEEAHAL